MQTVIAFLSAHYVASVFVGSFLFGDSVIFTASYLAGLEELDIAPVIVASFVGVLLADSFWFAIGGWGRRRFGDSEFLKKEREKAAVLIEKVAGSRPYTALIVAKFLYGVRIAVILYAAARGVSWPMFLLFDGIGMLLWLVVFFPLAYFAGLGLEGALPNIGTLQAVLVVLAASTIGFRLLTIWITNLVQRR